MIGGNASGSGARERRANGDRSVEPAGLARLAVVRILLLHRGVDRDHDLGEQVDRPAHRDRAGTVLVEQQGQAPVVVIALVALGIVVAPYLVATGGDRIELRRRRGERHRHEVGLELRRGDDAGQGPDLRVRQPPGRELAGRDR